MPDKLLCYVFVSIFGLGCAQTTIYFKSGGSEQLTNKNVPVKIFNCSVNIYKQRIVHGRGPSNTN